LGLVFGPSRINLDLVFLGHVVYVWALGSINNVGLDQGVQVAQGALSLCHLLPPCESLGVQARFGKHVIEARVRSLSYKLGFLDLASPIPYLDSLHGKLSSLSFLL